MISNINQQISPQEEQNLFQDISKNVLYNFGDPNTIQDFQKRVLVAIKYSKSIQAYKLLKEFEVQIAPQEDNVKNKYQEVLTWLVFAAFDKLTEQEMLNFFSKQNISVILQDEYYNDLISKIQSFELKGSKLRRKRFY